MIVQLRLKITIILFLINVNCALAQSDPFVVKRNNDVMVKKEMADKSSLKNIGFKNVGPSIMSGRVTATAVNPNNANEFYVAYATGGLWYTKNNGQSLIPVFERENSIGIGDVAVNWNTNTIWVGTGEANSSRSSYAGDGLYKSTNGGKNWDYMGLPASQHISKIVLHPTNNDVVWVGVIGNLYSDSKDRGLYKTTDGGKNWKQTLFVDNNTGIIDVSMATTTPQTMYATAWYRTRRAWNFEEGGSTSGLYKSTDGGDNWKLISTKNSGLPTGENIGRMGVAVFQGNPNIVYAVVDNQNHRPDTATKRRNPGYPLSQFKEISKEQFAALDSNKLETFLRVNNIERKYDAKALFAQVKADSIKATALYEYLFDANTALYETPVIGAEVYRSNDAGNSWRKTNTKALELYNTYGYYFGVIYVAPNDADKVIIAGYDLELSTDGGKTFKVTDKPSTHADWHACWINPANNKHWIAGNDGGCNVTYDDGAHWFKANTPSVGQFYNVAVDNAKPYNIYGGLQDNGTWYGPSTTKDTDQWEYDGSYPWKQIGGGDGMQVQVDTRTNKIAYVGSQFGFYGRLMLDDNKRIPIYPRAPLGKVPYRYNWQTPILLSKYNQDIFYYGTNYLHRSFDKGETFEVIGTDLTNGPVKGDIPFGTMTSISESPLQLNLLYTGTDDGNIQVSKDGGYHWTLISKSLPQGLYISRVTSSKFNVETVYASAKKYRNDDFSPYVYVSTNAGQTWKSIVKGLPQFSVNVIIEDQVYDDILYAGTDNGLFASFNKGESWMAMAELPSVPIHDLIIQKRENDLVIGTHGRSIYIIKLAEVHKEYNALNAKK